MTDITKEELLKLYDMDLDELIEMSSKITKENFKNEVEVCSIISARTGKCGENCKYCSQSIHNHADIVCHPLLSVEEVYQSALKAKENGATRFCIVTSGRSENGDDFNTILEMIKKVASIPDIHCCASLGLLNEEQIKQIKEAGVERFNHNINTSQNYHNEICTTHHFEDRIKTVKNIVKNGIEACTGVILGMGETKEDRVDMALSLAELNPKTVPINVLNPIKGTPLEDYSDKITEEDVIRTICIFRIAMPKAILRYAGGRNTRLSLETQKLGLKAGVNGLLAGDYLTTNGEEVQKDKEMLESIDLEFSKE
ncbi:TPA: biotin synthase BioB [Candidatus Gastranaerophilales bacterium HUM_9]|nr:MAG TPA: biotin synthase BioB [Candidatus Gastranaerophilales bacterium HUM_9]HBX35617.1 biotin synthase BioB [Cyanobacteria bacterium UBA11440]